MVQEDVRPGGPDEAVFLGDFYQLTDECSARETVRT